MSSEVETSRIATGKVPRRDSSTSLGMTKGKLFVVLEVYHDDVPRSAAMNMAIDEALFESVKVPSLRFYRWDHPALSFGYFGRFSDVSSYQPERELVRRWTGGGIVLHGDDLTYSIVIPARDSAFGHSSMSIYEKIHEAIRRTLAANGAPAELAVAALYERRRPENPAVTDRRYNKNACFANPVRADVLVNGRKVAGAAQRKTRAGLLQQGSIQLANGRVRPTGGHVDLTPDFAAHFTNELAHTVNAKDLPTKILDRAQEIAAEKYGTGSWLQRR